MPDFGRALKQLRDRERQPFLAGMSPIARLSLSTQLQYLKARSERIYVPISDERSHRTLLPPGTVSSNRVGSHYVLRKSFPETYYHGTVCLSRFSPLELSELMRLMKQRTHASVDRNRIIFLDTETTGIQGGTGICPFLIGVGHFDGDSFEMIQYFIRDFDEEPSMLCALLELLDKFDLVVTYNGASFDIPLLESRFTLARMDNPFARLAHFDLLNTARRLWRNGHGSCRLAALERLLSFVRGPDIPGSMIPRVYFDFLQQRPTPELPHIFTHNRDDVVSLIALTIHACDRVAAEPALLDEPLDIYSLARVYENAGDWVKAKDLYEKALAGGLPESSRVKALESLSVMHRRNGDHEESLRICRELMASEIFSLTGYEGAAVYHERFAGSVEAALHIVEDGLRRLAGSTIEKRWTRLLRARWERLQQKVIGFPSSEAV
jgi:uncharacterized protein YprB with RNaseH-like and TPR domain